MGVHLEDSRKQGAAKRGQKETDRISLCVRWSNS